MTDNSQVLLVRDQARITFGTGHRHKAALIGTSSLICTLATSRGFRAPCMSLAPRPTSCLSAARLKGVLALTSPGSTAKLHGTTPLSQLRPALRMAHTA